MTALIALALLLGAPQGTDAFPARVTRAKAVEASPAGAAYQKALWSRIGNPATDAYKGCLASNAPADRTPFTLVADVGADGRPRRIEVRPATPVATCMAGQFATWTLPDPPAQPAPYPIEIDFSVAR
jgi:hypothetical protein